MADMEALECSERSENLINRKIINFYIEAIPPKKLSTPKKYFFEARKNENQKFQKPKMSKIENRKCQKSKMSKIENRKCGFLKFSVEIRARPHCSPIIYDLD